MKVYKDLFSRIISPENLFSAWDSFKSDKRKKLDVQAFERNLEQNIFQLHRDLKGKTYRHGPYSGFYIRDPKQRHIHKALVRDRVLHHAVFSVINPIFEPTFIATSFSCRIGFGSHRGVNKLAAMAAKVSRNGKRPCFVLKCDIKKFFDSVDHEILLSILKKRIKDKDAFGLLEEVINSFPGLNTGLFSSKGLPIGNLTSQLFANVYMNEFDQFVKQDLRVRYYARYTDDFVIVSATKEYLVELLTPISRFLEERLTLRMHPKKVGVHKFHKGVDFLGYIVFPKHRLLRTKTKQRIFKNFERRVQESRVGEISEGRLKGSLNSYLGVFSHADGYQLSENLKNKLWLNRD